MCFKNASYNQAFETVGNAGTLIANSVYFNSLNLELSRQKAPVSLKMRIGKWQEVISYQNPSDPTKAGNIIVYGPNFKTEKVRFIRESIPYLNSFLISTSGPIESSQPY
jgi:hypothetical protein